MANFNELTGASEIVQALATHVKGKTFLITGPSKDSLGAEAALSLATAEPARIILVGRSENKISPVIEEIKQANSKVEVILILADFLDDDSVRDAAAKINKLDGTIDASIASAGTMAVRQYSTSKSGIESQLAANFVGHFLLANLIAKKFAKESSFVTVTSLGYEGSEVNFDDPNYSSGKSYSPWGAYGQATTAKILHAYAMARKPGVSGFSVHPGYVPDSGLQANNGVDMELLMEGYKLSIERNNGKEVPQQPPRTKQQGAATIVLAAIDPSLKAKSPAFMWECTVKEARSYATSEENVDKLWKLGEKLVGETFAL